MAHRLLFDVDQLFVPIFGLLLLFTKIMLRHVAKRLASLEVDTREMLAWFGVDLSVLNLSAWVGARLQTRLLFDDRQTALAYALLIVFVIITTCIYKRYLRLDHENRPSLLHTAELYAHIFVALAVGFVGLFATSAALLGSAPHG